MSTRANIKFEDENGNKMHIDKSCDGFPEAVLSDIKKAIKFCEDRYSSPNTGQLISAFFGLNFKEKSRFQDYEPCVGYELAGDESYLYYVKWNNESKKYDYGVI